MNVLYLPNQVPAPINRSFAFNRKNERIDWRRIGTNALLLSLSGLICLR